MRMSPPRRTCPGLGGSNSSIVGWTRRIFLTDFVSDGDPRLGGSRASIVGWTRWIFLIDFVGDGDPG